MHKLLPRATSFLDAAVAAPLLLSSPRLPVLRLSGSPFLAARPGANPSCIRSPPWLRCDGARRRGFCSTEAARRGDDAGEEREKGVGGRAVLDRRQRGRSDALVGSGELLAIPGVGPRNLRKLVDKGFAGVAQLKQLYRDKFFGKSNEKMVEFLQNSVGIIHKNLCYPDTAARHRIPYRIRIRYGYVGETPRSRFRAVSAYQSADPANNTPRDTYQPRADTAQLTILHSADADTLAPNKS